MPTWAPFFLCLEDPDLLYSPQSGNVLDVVIPILTRDQQQSYPKANTDTSDAERIYNWFPKNPASNLELPRWERDTGGKKPNQRPLPSPKIPPRIDPCAQAGSNHGHKDLPNPLFIVTPLICVLACTAAEVTRQKHKKCVLRETASNTLPTPKINIFVKMMYRKEKKKMPFEYETVMQTVFIAV